MSMRIHTRACEYAYAYSCMRARERACVRNENWLMHSPFRSKYPANPATPANPHTDGMSALCREGWRESFTL
jgi:hypothetical protein